MSPLCSFIEQDCSEGNEPPVLKRITKYTTMKMCSLGVGEGTQKLGTHTVLADDPSS